jgi:hypothetical protein
MMTRRGLCGWAALTVVAVMLLGTAMAVRFPLAPLPYAYDALEPHIDKLTMQLHHVRRILTPTFIIFWEQPPMQCTEWGGGVGQAPSGLHGQVQRGGRAPRSRGGDRGGAQHDRRVHPPVLPLHRLPLRPARHRAASRSVLLLPRESCQ